MLGGGHHAQARGRQGADDQTQPQTGDHEVGIQHRQRNEAQVVAGREHIRGPTRDQVIATCGDQQSAARDDPVADRVAIQPPSRAPTGNATRNRSSRKAAWIWSWPSTP